MRFQIVQIKPNGFEFVESFRETMEVMQECLVKLGHKAQIQTNQIDADAIPILFGAHHIDPSELNKLPTNSIVFNLEQLVPGYPWFSEQYLQTLSRFRVWDYSATNVDYLHSSGISPTALHVPFGYSPCLTRISPAAVEDVDVLFFGIQSERRMRILHELGNHGINVVSLNNVWGADRDAWIARSKLVINIHLVDNGQFEIVRILFLLANGKSVVSEASAVESYNDGLQDRYVVAPYDGLVDACLLLLESHEERTALQAKAAAVSEEEDLQAMPHIESAVRSLLASSDQTDAFRLHLETMLSGHSPYFRDFTIKGPLDLPLERIAFYLPQFHRCDENDTFWGKGFTEWNLVTRALPKFVGHEMPRLPGDLGYYDLSNPTVLKRQVELARNYGLTGFMFFFYSFGGKTVLETPLRNFLSNSDLDFKFSLMWANENWTRRWDGFDEQVLLHQGYSTAGARLVMEQMLPYFEDPRYLRFDDRPILTVYRPNLIPNVNIYKSQWTDVCVANGVNPPYLIMALASNNLDPSHYGFDAALEYPPHQFQGAFGRPTAPVDIRHQQTLFDPNFAGAVMSYDKLVDSWCAPYARPFRVFRTAFPSWDNTARRRNGGSWTFVGGSPSSFARWISHIRNEELGESDSFRMICINAWNEWGEGAFLEPDSYYGYAYLDALYEALR
jgi:hypothetical protein